MASEVDEVEKGGRGAILLPHEQQGRLRSQQIDRGENSIPPGTRQRMEVVTGERIPDLIVILYKEHEAASRLLIDDRSPGLALPMVPLPLIQKSAFQGREKLLWRTPIVRVVRFAALCGGNP